jgi:nucleoside-diphosphate-sugar epimerase
MTVDLDDARTLRRLAPFGRWVIHLAPPPPTGVGDPRSRRLLAVLARPAPCLAGRLPARWVYVSTTGVYGDCGGAQVDETRPVAPASARARRRVAAEVHWRAAGRRGRRLTVLRVPGIYAGDRLPVDRLRAGLPTLRPEDDVHTNHIHADDLARVCLIALMRGAPNRVVHAVDDSDLKMGEYFDLAADALALPRPPRLTRAQVAQQVSPATLSFMSESRRLRNRRLRVELAVALRFPTVAAAIAPGLLD